MKKQIASIYFDEVEARRPLYGGYYKIPAVAKGDKPFILTIDDKIQRSQEPSPDGKSKVTQQYLIDGRDIATDIVREWTTSSVGMTPDCRPGIWIVRDEVPVLHDGTDPKFPAGLPQFDADRRPMWREATAEEKKAMWDEDMAAARAADATWAQYQIQTGDVLAEDPKQWVLISKLMKTACRAYGKERPWLQELKDSDIKHCWSCTKAIPIHALRCMHCQEIVEPERYAEEKQRRQEIIDGGAKGAVRPPVQPAARQPVRA